MTEQINDITMNKILLAFIICLSCSAMIYAQSDRKLKKQIDELTAKKAELDMELERINTAIAQIENRSFIRETPEQRLKKKLASYDDVQALVHDDSLLQELGTSPIAGPYSLMIEMYLSLQKEGGYQKEKNEYHKSLLENLKGQLSQLRPAHKEGFIESVDYLSELIMDYRFTMFELVRVFDVVDSKSKEGVKSDDIYGALVADGETEFIDKIPYTKDLLETYIANDDKGKRKIRLYEVFSTIK